MSAGEGAKGHRHYHWAFVRLDHDRPAPDGQAGRHWPLVRRNRTSGELAFYRCFTPRSTPLAVLVNVAGRRWTVEEAIQAGKGLCGLDQHQVRRWRSWYRWATLAMLAHAVLAITALAERARDLVAPGLVPVTCNEVQQLFAALLARPARDRDHRLRWSAWRRRPPAASTPATTTDRQPGTHEDHHPRLESVSQPPAASRLDRLILKADRDRRRN